MHTINIHLFEAFSIIGLFLLLNLAKNFKTKTILIILIFYFTHSSIPPGCYR